jgi:hypothetical protein
MSPHKALINQDKSVFWKYATAICLLTALLALGYIGLTDHWPRVAFVYNQTVFDQFKGKVELEEKLSLVKERNKSILDSLANLIRVGRSDLMSEYQQKAETYGLQEEQLTEQYTRDIWVYLNDAIYQYGKENKYDYILGTSGSGNLMYADSVHNITDEVVIFVNKMYTGK